MLAVVFRLIMCESEVKTDLENMDSPSLTFVFVIFAQFLRSFKNAKTPLQ